MTIPMQTGAEDKLWSMKGVEFIPLVISSLDTIGTELPLWLGKVGVHVKIGHLQL